MTKTHALAALLFMLASPYPGIVRAASNLQMDGTLVTEPCTLDPDGNTMTLSFGTIIKKGLYRDHRTLTKPFKITLSDCDISLGRTVTLMFTGTESQAVGMNGYLATTGPGSNGVVIGLETNDGKPVEINKSTASYELQDGVTEIPLRAYVQAIPEAINSHSLVAGDFSAIATLDVGYP